MTSIGYQAFFFLGILLVLSVPLGLYIKQIMQGNIPKWMRWMQPVERLIYRILGPTAHSEMSAKKYVLNVVLLSGCSLIFLV